LRFAPDSSTSRGITASAAVPSIICSNIAVTIRRAALLTDGSAYYDDSMERTLTNSRPRFGIGLEYWRALQSKIRLHSKLRNNGKTVPAMDTVPRNVINPNTSGYELVRLANGSYSLHSLDYRETFHPVIGPVAEAEVLYLKQLRLAETL